MSKKKEGSISEIVRNTLALVLITLAAVALLGMVRELTAEPITRREEQEKQAAYQKVFREADRVLSSEEIPELSAALARAPEILGEGYQNAVCVDEACLVKNQAGESVGYILTVTDKKGYGGAIQMVFGYRVDGTICGMEFLKIGETAGFGLEAEKNPEWRKQFYDTAVSEFKVTKAGAAAAGEIDALSGATITSRAVTGGINGGLKFAQYLVEQNIGGVR